MLRKTILFTAALSMVLLMLAVGSADAQIMIKKTGRPWEVDGAAAPISFDDRHSGKTKGVIGEFTREVPVNGSGSEWSHEVYRMQGKPATEVPSPALRHNVVREILYFLYFRNF
jgi:hypothetical protein